ncbi:Lipid droplet-regulating VLDL assembly factor AUP1 [Frankliniella fusca]|uniref:Lipid droplet-regulating VLDL assembly factor AUP1 n=1 Tax=Frankliniella fusca TaxID=407009 RepID=A0AAE1HCS0_9NEOP|nr:Lipid droplet-regulating VLDL assembly factor AUP1 [Frankliniella fusca]
MILKTLCFTLGIVVREECVEKCDESAQVIVTNHISMLDYIPIHLLSGCVTPGRWDAPSAWALSLKSWGHGDTLLANVRAHLSNSDTPVLVQPEGATTSGTTGLLKFESWPLETVTRVQPAVIRVWRPAMADIAVTVVAASELWDIFFYLFVPFTVFTVRYLNVVELRKDETPAHCMERIEAAIAQDLGVRTTKFTAKDKMEYEKRYLAELYRPVAIANGTAALRLQPTSAQLLRMSNQVKEVLPNVPLDAIRRDLARTWDVDLTITNILEGLVPFVPEGQGPALPSRTQRPSEDQMPASSSSSKKSVQTGSLTFQERKAKMIEEARKKYIEKHGLQVSSLSDS